MSTRLGVRTPSAASHAHHPFEFAGLFLRVPVNICLDVLRRELELLEKRRAHVGVRKYAKKVLGVELIAAKLICVLRGTLQQFDCLLTESVGRIERAVEVVDKGILVFPMTGIGEMASKAWRGGIPLSDWGFITGMARATASLPAAVMRRSRAYSAPRR